MEKLFLSLLLVFGPGLVAKAHAAEKVTVFAAASMQDVVEEAARAFSGREGVEVTFSFAASSVLAKQIEAGAPASIFISADEDWMNYLEERKLISAASRRVIAGNALVIAMQAGEKRGEAADILRAGRFAMGDPSNVPAGKYGKAALEKLGLWTEVEKNAVFAENVRVALQYVNRGEANAAIVYASDLAAAPGLTEAYRFPASSHAPILYPAALIGEGTAEARTFLDFLSGFQGQAIIRAKGFVPAAEAAN
ncbi:molybdate ABC transporter substrate-binding protein [Phyllobacterium salinisoli]|uniref:Molybdate ABC transporter substrate-binding protein n=1 Tax=Phyllobacterium salinisoli TaxID=1899321 RepID=A0A368K5L6_9HYPH|nr:molybdate ABC transporter substrate-binding protein [Phyllobacterium salinisoli]RCS23935.1 molybdate ABC transporter substrate-binding protein [Phyllobacterium salinisoli]